MRLGKSLKLCFKVISRLFRDKCRPAVHDQFQKTAHDPLWCFLTANDIKRIPEGRISTQKREFVDEVLKKSDRG